MSAKQEAIDLIEKLPEESSITDNMVELYFKSRVENGLKDIDEGRLLSQEEVERKMKSWAQSIGQKRGEVLHDLFKAHRNAGGPSAIISQFYLQASLDTL